MGFKKAILAILLLIILTMGAASAADTNTTSDNLVTNENTNLELNESNEVLSVDETDVISDPGNGTFTEIKDLIDSASSEDTINLSGHYYGSGSSISIDKTVTLRGIGETILYAQGLSSILSVSASNVRIENIKFVNGQNSGDWGGAINWEGDSGVLINSTFINNAASWGAGIFWWAEDGYMANCTFKNNTAERYGGALYVNGRNLRMLNSLFKNNIVTESISSWEGGGAIYTDGNDHLVANSTFISNKAINSWAEQSNMEVKLHLTSQMNSTIILPLEEILSGKAKQITLLTIHSI